MKIKPRKLMVIVRYNRWHDRFIGFFKYFSKNDKSGLKAGELRFDIYFDKRGKIIECRTPVLFNSDGKIEFINKEII